MMIWQEVVKTNSHTHFSLSSPGREAFRDGCLLNRAIPTTPKNRFFFPFSFWENPRRGSTVTSIEPLFFLALLEAWKKSYLFFSRLFNIIPTWRPKSVQTRFRQFMDAHKKYTSTTFFLFLPFDSQRYACLLEMSICPTVDIPSVFLGWKPKKTEGTKFEKKQDTGCRHCTETLSRGHALSRFNLKKEDAQPPPPHFDTEKWSEFCKKWREVHCPSLRVFLCDDTK